MNKTLLALWAFLSMVTISHANIPHLKQTSDTKKTKAPFYKTFGEKGIDAAHDVITDKDGNFVVIGKSNSYGGGDMNLNVLKLSPAGEIIWNKNYGADESEEGNAIVETHDGGYVIVGHSDSYGAGPDIKDIWVLKIDNGGNKVWAKTFGSRESIDEAVDVVKTDEHHFLVVATTTPISGVKSNILLIKIDDKGNKNWEQSYGGEEAEIAAGITKGKHGYYIAGHTESHGSGKWDVWVAHIDNRGHEKWAKTYGGGDTEMANAIAADSEGNLIIAGYSYTFAEGSHDAWVLKLDEEGKQLWAKPTGGLSTDEAFNLVVNPDNSIVVAGYTDIYKRGEYGENVSKEGNNLMIYALSSDGNEMWKKQHGGIGMQVARSISAHNDGYVIVGYTTEAEEESSMDMFVMSLGKNGAMP